MQFELHVTCTKDIDKLKIDFADGTSVVQHSIPDSGIRNETSYDTKEPQSHGKQQLLDTDADWGSISQEVVELPQIEEKSRSVSVAEELQNLDI